eukprot:GHVS01094352.1.p1 GENE.GHVS01094352.1~~GHVS01094352.1.p1  ORF type:complete len:450 (+),score=74.81 GHVS01094352.1:141-1490(+)
MGIKGLAKFVADYAPKAIKQREFNSFVGRTLAIDASMSLYQFMIAIRDTETHGNLTNEEGETTSHISGFLARAVRLLEHGIKPVYVFDGKPPTLKGGELAKRKDKRDRAEHELEAAREVGDMEEVRKQIGRTVKVTKQHNEEVKKLLGFMGIPVVDAPCEAEAQCAELTKTGKAFATATEDADALTFGSTVLVRHLNFSDSKAKLNPILAIDLQVVLKELGLTMSQFVDFCILCGCDYCDTIRGIGAKTAYNLIKEHKDIETVIQNIDIAKHPLPEHFPYKQAREFFHSPEVIQGADVRVQWKDADNDGLIKFLVEQNNFNAARVDAYINRLKKARGKSCQTRLESFFGPITTVSSSTAAQPIKDGGKKGSTGKGTTVKASASSKNSTSKAKTPAKRKAVKAVTGGGTPADVSAPSEPPHDTTSSHQKEEKEEEDERKIKRMKEEEEEE